MTSPSPTTIDQHLQRIEEDGYTILDQVIDPQFIDDVLADLHRLMRDRNVVPAANLFEGFSTLRIYNLLVHGKLYERIAEHEAVLPLVEKVLDRGCLVSS